MDHVADSSSEDLEATLTNQQTARKTPWRVLAAAAGVLAATAAVGTLSWSAQRHFHGIRPDVNAMTTLVKEEHESLSEQESICEHLPFLRLMKKVSSNLGGDGPDKDAEEGIIYKAKGFHMGFDTEDLEVHLHATNEYHNHRQKEGNNIDEEYKPAWPKENGIDGHFASVNIKPNSNVTLRVHAYDATEKKDLKMKKFAMTFFDLDTGAEGKKCVEYVKLGGFDKFFTDNDTEINITQMDDGDYIFKATKEGNGDDNPKDPLQLTKLQKDRVFSVVYSDVEEAKFEIGASAGETARVFDFALRPALRCAWTKMPDGNLIAADSKDSPVTILEGSAKGLGHALSILALATSLFLFN